MILQNIFPLTNTLAPADQAAVADAVRNAYGERTAVYPIGGGTRLDYGMHPSEPGIGLSLEKLDKLIDYRPDDWTITVEAGMTIVKLSKILAKRRQRLPINVALPDRATIGGTASLNPSGPRQFAHGTIRDYVLGLTAVDGRGTIFSGGGRVLKNAAGYNLCRLMVGSLGTLGVITQLTLMVRPLPETSAVAACDLPDFETAEKLLAELMQSPTRPAALELALGDNRRDNPAFDPTPEGCAARLYVGFEGTADEVQWMLDAQREKWQAAGINSPMIATDARAKKLWDWLTGFSADVQVGVRPSALIKMIRALVSLDPDCTIQAHAGNGILQAMFSPAKTLDLPHGDNQVANHDAAAQNGRNDIEQQSFAFFLRRELRPLVEATGGKLVVLKNSPGNGLIRRDIWGPPSEGFTVMQSLKDRFDPAGILNPGRFIFDAYSKDHPLPLKEGVWSGKGQGEGLE